MHYKLYIVYFKKGLLTGSPEKGGELGLDVPATVHAMPLSMISPVHIGSGTCFPKKEPSSDRAPWTYGICYST